MDSQTLPSVAPDAEPFTYDRGRVGCLLIHGFAGTPWSLKELGEFLAKRGITVSAPLLAGHGTRVNDLLHVSWHDWVEVTKKEIIRLKTICDEIFLVGLSMGGSIALLLASQSAYAGVVSLSTPVMLDNPWIRLIPFIRYFIRYRKRTDYSQENPLAPEMGYDRYPLVAVYELNKMLHSVQNRLSLVKCPVLVMHATEDRRVSFKNARIIYDGIDSGDKYIFFISGSSHMITKGTCLEQVENKVLKFIESYSKLEK